MSLTNNKSQHGFSEPFGNESEVFSLGDLTIENRLDRISIYGSFDITLDIGGKQKAVALRDILINLVAEMDKRNLPCQIDIEPPVRMSSPL